MKQPAFLTRCSLWCSELEICSAGAVPSKCDVPLSASEDAFTFVQARDGLTDR